MIYDICEVMELHLLICMINFSVTFVRKYKSKFKLAFLLSIYLMKVLISFSCTEKPNFFIEVLDELELFIDKKVIFDEKKFSVGPPCRLPSVSKFCNPHTFFPFNLDTSPFQVKVF
jgi:hypothetical protein